MKLITREMLLKHGACSDQMAVFEREWPQGAEVTVANVLRAIELGLDIDWLRRLVTDPPRLTHSEAIVTALRAYNGATATALRAYREATAPVLVAALLASEEPK